jgi:hypothetical protein
VLFSACKKDKNDQEELETSAAMENLADAVIIPEINLLQSSLADLHVALDQFCANPENGTLSDAREKLKLAWLQWQHCSAFTFGPGENRAMKSKLNTFPVDIIAINSNVENGILTDLALDEQGLGTIDFLLNERGLSNEQILDNFVVNAFSENRKSYLLYCSEQISITIDAVSNDWDTYRTTFISSIGAANGSSLSLVVNEFIKDYEELKRNKLALPLGLLTLGISLPEKTEAYHAGYSSELAQEQLQALKNYFLGADGLGLDDLLAESGFISSQGGLLSDAIPAGFDESAALMELLTDPLSDQITTDPEPIENAYFNLQENLVMLKTEMPSALGVSITFADNDGD